MSTFLLRNVCGPRFTSLPPAWSIWQTAPLSLTSQWGADCHEKEHEENDRDVDQDGGVYDDEEDGEDPRSCLLLLVVVVDEGVHGDQNNDDDDHHKGREKYAVGDHDDNDNVGSQ